MAVFDDMEALSDDLVFRRIDTNALPPFALSPEQVNDLKSDARLQWYPMADYLRHPDWTITLKTIDDTGIFTVMGLRCVRADRLGA